MTTGSNNIIDDLVCLIHQYYPTGIPFNDPLYQSSDEYKNLKKKQKQMVENADYLAFIEKSLKKIFSQYAVINWTYMEEYPDIEYHILLHKNQDILDDDIRLLERLNGERRDLFLYISIIGKYYFFTINKTEKKNEKHIFSFDELHSYEEQERIAELEDFFFISRIYSNR